MEINNLKALQREILLGFWKAHILYHASKGPLVGRWMLRELGRHGYEISPGTLYPILHRLERRGYIASEKKTVHGRMRRVYRITPAGQKAFEEALHKVRELFTELIEEA